MTESPRKDPFHLTVVSGKGGTGKTSLVASLAVLAQPCVLADCDVDAPNLHLVIGPRVLERHEFWASRVVVRDPQLCESCGECEQLCRFRAITKTEIRVRSCEGCGLCVLACPSGALALEDALTGEWMVSETNYGPFVHARLAPGAENSGRLVTEVRNRGHGLAVDGGHGLLLVDGPPGIGCGVVASITGADLVLLVVEPTPSGIHDMVRVLELCRHFQVSSAVAINKWDLSAKSAEEIVSLCESMDVPIAARIPFDESVPICVSRGIPVVQNGGRPAADALRSLWSWLEPRCRHTATASRG